MSSKPELRLDWVDHKAAKYAVMNWHYSKTMPAGKLAKVGVWEGGEFIGVVLFGRGASANIGSAYRAKQTEVCELVRVALAVHVAPVSQIVSFAMRMLCKQSSGMRLIVSYADPIQDHHGGIYQAMNWIYSGSSHPQRNLILSGKSIHKNSAHHRWGTASPVKIRAMTGLDIEYGPVEWKHTYLYPLDKAMRDQIAPLAKPYPKRDTCAGSVDSDTSTFHAEKGGATPTPALQETHEQAAD